MHKRIYKFGLAGASLALVVISGSTVLALPTRANAHAQAADTSSTAGSAADAQMPSQAAYGKANGQAHLAAAKLKVCQNRQKAITNIMSRIADRGQKQLTLFTTIAGRTEAFYTDKGKTLDNYDTLVADVTAKQAAAQAIVDAVKSAGTGFDCNGANPQGFVATFKGSLKLEIAALQNYRTAVKNLIVGVKSVQSTATSAASQSSGGDQ